MAKGRKFDARSLAGLTFRELISELGSAGWLDHEEPYTLTPTDLEMVIEALDVAVEITRSLTPDNETRGGIHRYNKLSRALIAIRHELVMIDARVPSRVLQVDPPSAFNRRAEHPAIHELQVAGAATSITFRNLLGLSAAKARAETAKALRKHGVSRSISAIRDWERLYGATERCQKLQSLAEYCALAARAFAVTGTASHSQEAFEIARTRLTAEDIDAAIGVILTPFAIRAAGE